MFYFVIPSSLNAYAAAYLSFDDYRNAVKAKSLKMYSLQYEKTGAALEGFQASLMLSPQAFAEFEELRDKSPDISPETSGTERNNDQLKTGVQMQTRFGLKPRAFAIIQNQKLKNVSSLADPNVSLQRKGIGVEAEISLWKNALGKDVRGHLQSSKSISESKAIQAEASLLEFQNNTEILYYETIFLKEAIKIQTELINQGEKLVQWTKKQSENRLLEPVHVAEAEAAHQTRKFAMITLKQNLQSNLHKMAQLSGMEINDQNSFESIDKIFKSTYKTKKSYTQKVSIKSLEKAIEAEQIGIDLAAEDFKPDLNLKAQYLTFSNNGKSDDSSRCKTFNDCRSLALSLNFTVPLDLSTTRSGTQAANTRISSLQKNLEAEIQNSKVEILQMQTNLDAYEDQIISLEKLIDVQEKRLNKERERQSRGRATTFDLILSEQDLGESKIKLAEIKTKYISTITQFNLFEEAK